jgi:coenzyme F420 biosynthesis associated uncharacterized protein
MRRPPRRLIVGMVAAATSFVVVEAMRPRPGQARLVDWDEIRRLCKDRLKDDGWKLTSDKSRTAAAYQALATELEKPLLDAVGGMPAGAAFPPFDALSRHEWLDLNIDILSRTLEPLMEVAQRMPNSRIVELGRAGLDRYVATLLTFLGRRVLGQFDPQLLGREPLGQLEIGAPWGLYLVEPNIVSWETEAKLDPEQLRRWLILHEMTHAWQFAAHPWLRGYMNGMLQELISLATRKGDALSRLLSMTVGLRDQWTVVRKMQGAMTLIEGYSNLVMNIVGKQILPGFDQLEGAYRQRSSNRGPLEDLFWKVTGLEMKMQQYHRGEAFCSAVYRKYGMEVLNRAWEGPDMLPRLEEYDDPDRWYQRVGALRTLT